MTERTMIIEADWGVPTQSGDVVVTLLEPTLTGARYELREVRRRRTNLYGRRNGAYNDGEQPEDAG